MWTPFFHSVISVLPSSYVSVTIIETEVTEWKNGVHIADYIRRVDVPQSQFAFALRNQQVRYLTIEPKRTATIKSITLAKGPDDTAPVVMAVTVETP